MDYSKRSKTALSLCQRMGTSIFFLLLLIAPPGFTDEAKPRYVAGNGEDSSDCRNLFRPCRTLSYALTQTLKGDPILVGEGEYKIEDIPNLYSLLNANIKGGMDRLSHFSIQDPSVISTLTAVPLDYREAFTQAGFHVIVDSKGQSISKKQLQGFNQKMQASRSNHAKTNCVAGMAATFPCQNIDLLAHIYVSSLKTSAAAASDIWGFVDLNTRREYVIIGLSNGVALVDVSDPENPFVVGTQNGLNSTWRDIKIYQAWDASVERWHAWAYISTEANMGLAVLDLGNLPHGFGEVSYVSDFATAHNVYLANVDYTFGAVRDNATPMLTVAGSNLDVGKYRLYSLSNPASPQLIESQGSGYMHDAATVQINDNRKDTQCVNAAQEATCKLLADFNEGSVDIWDLTLADQPVRLSTKTYSNANYVHSGWWSEDGQYLYVQDELDELRAGLNTTLRAFDMSDLSSPQLLNVWTGPTRAIDHNGFVRGNRYYMSNYVEGLTVLDLSNPGSPTRAAWFDTEPASSSAVFEGAWGVYPFLPSGTLAVSDINTGLYLLQDNSLESPSGSLAFGQASSAATEGDSLTVYVERLDSSSGAISVNLSVQFLNADANDISLDAGSLSWNDGETGSKSVTIDIIDDGQNERDELLVLRLESPTGGASLKQPSLTYIRISDAGSPSVLTPLHNNVIVSNAQDKVLLTISRKGGASGATSVDWQLENLGSLGFDQSSGTVNWADGDPGSKTLVLSYTSKTSDEANFTLSLSNPINATLASSSVGIQKQGPVIITPNPGPGGAGSSSSNGGGGSMDLAFILLLILLVTAKQRNSHLSRRLHK